MNQCFNKEIFFSGHLPDEWRFLKTVAPQLGFVAVGVARAGKVGRENASRHRSFVLRGFLADMAYLSRNGEARVDLAHEGILPGAEVVVTAAFPFGTGTCDRGFWKHVAAYARGKDYHKTMRARLEQLADRIGEQFSGCRTRVFVDTAPVMERAWALACGIGTLGKNGMVMVPNVGPRVLLGEVVCAGVPEMAPAVPEPAFSLCGDCTACIDACPTGAMVAPAEVDARKCLSYWTIENRKDEIPGEIAGAADLMFGCDRCIEACPHDNTKIPSALEPIPSKETDPPALEALLEMEDSELKPHIKGTPLERTGPQALKRNIRALLQGRGAPCGYPKKG